MNEGNGKSAPASLVVFGATSTMATEVARLYAPQNGSICLIARDGDALARLKADIGARSLGSVQGFIADLSELARHGELIEQVKAFLPAEAPVHALIAYGTLTDEDKARSESEYFEEQLTTNFLSAAHLAQEAARWLATRPQKNALAVITSVAGDRGRQSNYVYGAAKGGLSRFLEGMRHRYANTTLAVIDIKPGFVDTKMTASFKKGPLWAAPEKVAGDIENALRAGKGRTVYTPGFWRFVMLLIQHVPAFLFHRTKL